MGYIHLRKRANKVGFMGFIQPFRDAIKLLIKKIIYLNKFNRLIYFFAPLFNFILVSFIYILLPFKGLNDYFFYGFLIFFCCLRLNVYRVIIISWSSNSKYTFLSAIRVIIQLISYEIRLIVFILRISLLLNNLRFIFYEKYQIYIWLIELFFLVSFILFIIFMIESNRVPFDFIEGESELVSGFNIEYGSGLFAIIYISEYLIIIFLRLIIVILFYGGVLFNYLIYFKILIVISIFLFVRGSFPRYRYDKLRKFAWIIFLPISFILFLFYFYIVWIREYLINF